jgi:hypothetical protein
MKAHLPLSLVALGALFVLAGVDARAQTDESSPISSGKERPPVLIGGVLGVNRNFHSGGFRTVTADENCPVFESGGGWGFAAGLSAEIAMGERGGIVPRLTYESRPGSFENDLPNAYVIAQNSNEPMLQSVVASSDVSYSILNAEVLYKQEIANVGPLRIGVAAGPAFGLVLDAHNRQYEDLVEPASARFTNVHDLTVENGGRRLVFFDDELPGKNGMRLSLKAGVQAELGAFGNAWIISPGLYYDFGLSDVTESDNWQLNTLTFMVDFRRAF